MKKSLAASIALFVIACCLPALEFRHSEKGIDDMWGANALAVGWSGIFAGIVAWYANPIWFFGLIFGVLGKRNITVGLGVVSILLALTTFAIIGRELPADEGNVTHMTLIALLP